MKFRCFPQNFHGTISAKDKGARGLDSAAPRFGRSAFRALCSNDGRNQNRCLGIRAPFPLLSPPPESTGEEEDRSLCVIGSFFVG